MGEEWYYWDDSKAHSPYFNMAMDEVLLSEAPNIGKPLIRIYYWDRPSLTIGSSQKYPSELEDRYTIVRRPTGGGNVFHDIDLTYTVVIPPGHAIALLDRLSSYQIFHNAMLSIFSSTGGNILLKQDETLKIDRATMKCFESPSKFDVVTDSGAKYAGAAQRRTRDGILHQGSIQLSAIKGDMLPAEKLLECFARKFEISYVNYTPQEHVSAAADRITIQKYQSRSWNCDARY